MHSLKRKRPILCAHAVAHKVQTFVCLKEKTLTEKYLSCCWRYTSMTNINLHSSKQEQHLKLCHNPGDAH